MTAAGTRLGPYEIVSPIGAGGMGEVWRARDTRLDRSVAVKILPPGFAANAQSRLRFEREAKVISQLNHPNICTLYDVGENYLVMELLEGESLAERLARGPLPVDQVLRYGIEIADALEKAHRMGIVHRDLKPGNVMITRTGAKLLDFGLAKSTAVLQVSATDATAVARSEHEPLTAEGTIVGTFQYMAPEQLEGSAEVDARTDIFALGALLYEMVTGKRAFDGKTRTSVIAAIVAADPKPITALQPLTPRALERIITLCLRKDPEDRWQSAHDVRLELEAIRDGELGAVEPRKVRPVLWLGAALLALLAVAGAFLAGRRTSAGSERIGQFTIAPPRGAMTGEMALSPDGRTMAMVAQLPRQASRLWLRDMVTAELRVVEGTDGARMPFWSPDGSAVAFNANQTLYRIGRSGGSPQPICPAPGMRGGSWGSAGKIIFARESEGIYSVDAGGGTPVAVSRRTGRETGHQWPAFLPDGRHYVYLSDAEADGDHSLRVGSTDPAEPHTTLRQAMSSVAYANGHLFFVRARNLVAQPFDPRTRKLTGDAVPVADQLHDLDFHSYAYSVADDTIVFAQEDPKSRIHIYSRDGKPLQSSAQVADWVSVKWSPDGRKVVMERVNDDRRLGDLWLLDLERDAVARVTSTPAWEMAPLWSPDGRRLLFSRDRDVVERSIDGGRERVVARGTDTFPSSWVGDRVASETFGAKTVADVSVLDMTNGRVQGIAATEFWEGGAQFSPDGKWIVYHSGETDELFAQPYPPDGSRWQLTTDRGIGALWRSDGKELFYVRSSDWTVMAADFQVRNGSPDLGPPRALFRVVPKFYKNRYTYDVSRDGQRFILNLLDSPEIPVNVVLGWKSKLGRADRRPQ